MKKYLPVVFSLAMGLTSNVALGDVSGPYIGARTGTISVDISAYDDVQATGFAVGYNINWLIGLELEALRSATGDLEISSFDDAEFEINTTAFYATFRSKGDLYVKGKAGILSEQIKIKGSEDDDDTDDAGLSLGAAVGYDFGPVSVEANYTIIEEDAAYTAIGVNLHF